MDTRSTLVYDVATASGAMITAMLNDYPPARRVQIADAVETMQARIELTVQLAPLAMILRLVPADGGAMVELARYPADENDVAAGLN